MKGQSVLLLARVTDGPSGQQVCVCVCVCVYLGGVTLLLQGGDPLLQREGAFLLLLQD